MERQLFETLGAVAGLGGLAVGLVLILFKQLLKKMEVPRLKANHWFAVVLVFMLCVWSFAIFCVWESRKPSERPIQASPVTPIQTNATKSEKPVVKPAREDRMNFLSNAAPITNAPTIVNRPPTPTGLHWLTNDDEKIATTNTESDDIALYHFPKVLRMAAIKELNNREKTETASVVILYDKAEAANVASLVRGVSDVYSNANFRVSTESGPAFTSKGIGFAMKSRPFVRPVELSMTHLFTNDSVSMTFFSKSDHLPTIITDYDVVIWIGTLDKEKSIRFEHNGGGPDK